MNCPHCNQTDGIFNAGDGMLGCIKCGERFNPQNIKPYKKLEDDMGKRGCVNCGRPKPILGRGLCGGCYYAATKHPEGSPEYIEALDKAKERFNDPNYKAYARTDQRKKTTPKVVKVKSPPQKVESRAEKSLTNITAIDMLIAERNMHQAEVFKLNKAIEILSA